MLRRHLEATLSRVMETRGIPAGEVPISVGPTKRPEHGDFATNIAMVTAKRLGMRPRDLAMELSRELEALDMVAAVEVAGPGFINIRLTPEAYFGALGEVVAGADTFGRSDTGKGTKVLVEFVSANPTGPLHVGHGRGAVTGDTVATIMDAAGYEVHKEYYVNDRGRQMYLLGRSLWFRYQELLGETLETPPDGEWYKGEYVIEIAEEFRRAHGDGLRGEAYEDHVELFKEHIARVILADIEDDLGELGVAFDTWYRETSLYDRGLVDDIVETLRAKDVIYDDDDGKAMFRVSAFEDEEDRVLVRENGEPTYFTSDIAYHKDKLDRGYDIMINVWGADHHGYIPRMRAALKAMGYDPSVLEVILVQFVNLVEGGVQKKMSTRSGEFVTLREVREQVGKDACRFFFVMRKSDSQLDFDLDLASSQSMDNPVYYVQYGHARISAILRRAREAGVTAPTGLPEGIVEALTLPEELGLARKILELPVVVAHAATSREPHHIVYYMQELVRLFHSYYTRYKHTERIISDDEVKTQGRLFLVSCLKQTLKNGLALFGVDAPEQMYLSQPEDDDEEL